MKTTPLFPIYQKFHGKVIDFFGWALPVQFESIIQEHLTVRKKVGIFDVSHMGEILVDGPDAGCFLDYLLTNHISSLQSNFIKYSPLCNENGGTVDDLLVYCLAPNQYLLVVNASNTMKDYEWLRAKSTKHNVQISNVSDETAQIAIQGPETINVLKQICNFPIENLKYYQFEPQVRIGNISVLLSRTGYTGEDGFEIYLRPEHAVNLWEILMEAGEPFGIKPIGLGARDTLRFESGMPLYGHELSEEISPIEAGLDRFVCFKKPDFIGKSVLEKQAISPRLRLLGIEMLERGIPRTGCRVFKEGKEIGFVTTGTYCPSLEKNLALALLDNNFSSIGEEVQMEIRGKLLKAKITKFPFYIRSKRSV